MISALSWVKRGVAKQTPNRFNLSEEEFQRISTQIGTELDIAKLEINDNETTETVEIDPELAEYDLENYDNDEGLTGIPVFGNVRGLAYHNTNHEDPYIQVEDKVDEEEELKEMEIMPTDNLLIACKTEEELSHVEVYVYAQQEDNLYVHHDIMLPSFPLCVEWMDFRVGENSGKKGNMIAIGTFDPEIEIWDLDTVDVVYPNVILGAQSGENKKKRIKKKKGGNTVQPDRHVAAVTCLSWNKTHRNLLLSGSSDTTVKLWDLTTATAVKSYQHHKDKVSALAWNQKEPTVFISGGYDTNGRVCALDSRAPDQVASWSLGSDVECLKWDPFRAERFLVSTEDGLVRCFDARNIDSQQPIYTIHAHDGAVSSFDINPHFDGLLVTGSADKTVKVWGVREGTAKTCLVSRDLGVGKVFSTTFSPDSPLTLACAGSKGKITLWNLHDNPSVRKIFNPSSVSETKTELITPVTDDEEEESDDQNGMEAVQEESDEDMDETPEQ